MLLSEDKKCLKEVPKDYFGKLIVPEGVIRIGPYAMEGCTQLSSIVIPASVKEVGLRAFFACVSLEEVTIMSSDILFRPYVFDCCTSLSTIKVPRGSKSDFLLALKGQGVDEYLKEAD